MRVNSRSLLIFIAACGFFGFSRLSSAQDEQGVEATPETPEPVQEEVAPPAEIAPTDAGEVQQQNDDSGAMNSTKKMDNHTSVGAGKSGTSAMTEVQEALNRTGAALKVDGKFGKSTKIALKKFQKKNKLKATGELDAETRQKLQLSM